MSVVSLLVMSLSVMWYNMEEEEGRGGKEGGERGEVTVSEIHLCSTTTSECVCVSEETTLMGHQTQTTERIPSKSSLENQ